MANRHRASMYCVDCGFVAPPAIVRVVDRPGQDWAGPIVAGSGGIASLVAVSMENNALVVGALLVIGSGVLIGLYNAFSPKTEACSSCKSRKLVSLYSARRSGWINAEPASNSTGGAARQQHSQHSTQPQPDEADEQDQRAHSPKDPPGPNGDESFQSLVAALKELGFTGGRPTWQEIQARFRELALKYHPDRYQSQNLPPEMLRVAEERFARISAAFEFLKGQN